MTLHCKSAEEVVTGWGGNFKAVALLVKTNQTTITVVLTTACSLVKCTTSHRVVGNSKKKKKKKKEKSPLPAGIVLRREGGVEEGSMEHRDYHSLSGGPRGSLPSLPNHL